MGAEIRCPHCGETLLPAGHSIARGTIRCPSCAVEVEIFPEVARRGAHPPEAGRLALAIYQEASRPPEESVYLLVGLPPGEESLRQKFRLFHRALSLHLVRGVLRNDLPVRADEVLARLDGCIEADPDPPAIRELLALLTRAFTAEPIAHLIRAQFTVDTGTAGANPDFVHLVERRRAELADFVREIA